MSLPQPSSRPHGDPSPQLFKLESKDSLGSGPANEMIARLAAAIAQEEDFALSRRVERSERRWPMARTIALLLAGCGLLWLLSYIFIPALS